MSVRRIKVKGKTVTNQQVRERRKKTPPRFIAHETGTKRFPASAPNTPTQKSKPGVRHHAHDAVDTLVVNALLDVLPKGTQTHPVQWVETPVLRLGVAKHGGVLYLEFPASSDSKERRGFALRLDDVTRYVQKVLLKKG